MRDSATGVERVVTTDLFYAVRVWERVPWYGQGAWHRRFLALAVAAFASVLLRPPRARARASLLGPAAPAERGRHRWPRRTIRPRASSRAKPGRLS